ncbi:MAG: cytochrome P450 [Actinomycetota bacterium]
MGVTDVFFNPLAEGYTADPWPHFAELREHDPVHKSLIERYFLFRYDDVTKLLRDPTLSVDDANIDHHDADRLDAFERAFEDVEDDKSMLGLDAPDHTRLRRLVSKAFTPTAIAALRPMVERMVEERLDDMAAEVAANGAADVVTGLAWPLPFDVISEMLGMPPSETAQVAEWSGAMVKTLDPIISEGEVFAAAAASSAMRRHLGEVIEWKRANPADDLLSALIAVEEDGDRLAPNELRAQVTLLFIAGHETTVNLIGTGIHELLRRPEQAAILRDDADLDANAVDELLRFVSPVQFSRRITLADVEIGEGAQRALVEKGTFVMAGLASANHDHEKWGPTADELDVRREGAGQHVSFGSGSHYCLGASLAKLEAQVAIGRFLRRFPGAAHAGEPTWNGRINLRGLDHLPVTL